MDFAICPQYSREFRKNKQKIFVKTIAIALKMCYNDNVYKIETVNDYGFDFALCNTRSTFECSYSGYKNFYFYGGTRDESRYG